jgi:flagella basal body P-ring formation protein FlgA
MRGILRTMRCAILTLAALVLGLVSRGAAEVATPSGRITIGRTATVDGRTVRLGDLAVLEGAATDFADLDLGPAPDPGGSRRLDGLAILRRLRAAGLDAGATRYEIAASVRIARAFQEVSGTELRDAVEREAGRLLAAGETIRNLEVPPAVRIPPGAYEMHVVSGTPVVRGAHRRLDVEVVQDAAVVATVPLRAEVAAVGPVVVARRPVPRGATLHSDDLTVEERDLAGVPPGALSELQQAVGKEARSALAADTPLTLQALANPLLVRRGDVVTVVVETPGLRLSVPGQALEAGAAGAAVRVRNRVSQQEISGQVVERGLVLVQY